MSKNIVSEILGPKDGESESSPGSLEMCVQELIEAIHARNVPDAVSALKAAVAEASAQDDSDED